MKEWKRWVWLLVLLGLVACGVGNPTPELIPETTETLEGPDVILFQQVGLDKVYIVKSIDPEGAEIEVCGWSKGAGQKYDQFVTCDGRLVERDQTIQMLEVNLTTEEILEIFISIVRQLQMK